MLQMTIYLVSNARVAHFSSLTTCICFYLTKPYIQLMFMLYRSLQIM